MKIFNSVLFGRWPDIGLWPVVLAFADENGHIEAHVRAIAGASGLPVEDVAACMRRFCSDDLLAPDADGRWRVVDCDTWLTRERTRPSAWSWAIIRDRIFKRDNYTCQYCGARGGQLECDHVIPFSRGGSDNDHNLATACKPCNQSKRDKMPHEWVNRK